MRLPDGLDWLLQPVQQGWCKYESLIDGTLDLADIATINEAISVHEENRARLQAAARQGA